MNDRFQRRTSRLAGQVSALARELAGRAGTRLPQELGSWLPGMRRCGSCCGFRCPYWRCRGCWESIYPDRRISRLQALTAYAQARDQFLPRPVTPAFFVSTAGTPVAYPHFGAAFRHIIQASGVGAASPVRASTTCATHSRYR